MIVLVGIVGLKGLFHPKCLCDSTKIQQIPWAGASAPPGKQQDGGSPAGPGAVWGRRHDHPAVPITTAVSLCSFVPLPGSAVCPQQRAEAQMLARRPAALALAVSL